MLFYVMLSGSEQRPEAGSCDHKNKPCGSIKVKKFLE
jgi:hypothetical protein